MWYGITGSPWNECECRELSKKNQARFNFYRVAYEIWIHPRLWSFYSTKVRKLEDSLPICYWTCDLNQRSSTEKNIVTASVWKVMLTYKLHEPTYRKHLKQSEMSIWHDMLCYQGTFKNTVSKRHIYTKRRMSLVLWNSIRPNNIGRRSIMHIQALLLSLANASNDISMCFNDNTRNVTRKCESISTDVTEPIKLM